MKRILSTRNTFILSILAACACAFVSSSTLAAGGELTVTFNTTAANGAYAPDNIHVVWIENSSNTFVRTIGLWANIRADKFAEWDTVTDNFQADVDARTGATIRTSPFYKQYTVTWNLTDRAGQEVPDGVYQIEFELTEENDGMPRNRATFTFNKNGIASTQGPLNQGGYQNVTIQYSPATASAPQISNTAASNVTTNSATIGGQVVSTGGENPSVKIYWGATDAGTGTWDNQIDLGVLGVGAFSRNLTGLTAGQTYYYRCYAQNSQGGTWASTTPSFITTSANPADIAVSPAALDFGPVNIGEQNQLILNIDNTGGDTLTVNSMQIVGLDKQAYVFTSAPSTPFTVPSGASETITVRFVPSLAQAYNDAAVSISSNDIDEQIVEVALTGQGISVSSGGSLELVSSFAGSTHAVALNGSNYAFAGQGATLTILDISNQAEPTEVGQVRLADVIRSIAISGDTIYAAAGDSGLLTAQVSDPLTSNTFDPIETPGHAYGVAAAGTTLCIADGLGGLSVYDISTANAQLKDTYQTTGSARAVAISGTTAYVLDEQLGIQIINVGTSTASLRGAFNEIEFGQSIAVSNGNAYVTDRLGNFFVVNVSNPASPTLRATIRLAEAGRSVSISGNRAYVAVGLAGVEVIDISNPASPVSLGVADTPGHASNIAATSSTAYVADEHGGLAILNLSNPASPQTIGSYTMGAAPYDVAGSLLSTYIAGDNASLTIADLSTQGTTVELGRLGQTNESRGIAVVGSMAYIAGGLAGLQIADISNPSAPKLVGSFQTDGYARGVAVSGSLALVTDGRKLYVLNISNPSAPVLTDNWQSNGFPAGVAIDGSYGYVADSGFGLWVVNLSNPSNVTEAGSYDTAGIAYDVEVSQGIAYVADGQAGVQIIDVSRPTSPELITTYDTAGVATGVAVDGSNLYVADGLHGLVVIDVTSPSTPKLVTQSALARRSWSVAVDSGNVFVADDTGGLLVMGTNTAPGGETQEHIVDNGDTGTSSIGNWSVSVGAGAYGTNSLYSKTAGSEYTYQTQATGTYDVYAWWTVRSSRRTDVPIEIYDGAALLETAVVNQQVNGGQWNLIKEAVTFSSGAKVVVISNGGGSTCADAIRLVPSTPPLLQRIEISGPSTVADNSSVSYGVTAYFDNGSQQQIQADTWDVDSTAANISPAGLLSTNNVNTDTSAQISASVTIDGITRTDTFAVTITDGIVATEVIVDNGENGTSSTGTWTVSVGTGAYGTNSLYSKAAGSTYTYQIQATGTYDVYAWWTERPSRRSDVPIEIYNGTSLSKTATVNQKVNGGQWNLVGKAVTFSNSARIVIVSKGGGSTCADAVKIVPATVSTADEVIDNGDQGTSSTGTWSISAGTGAYGDNSLFSNTAGGTYTYQTQSSGTYDIYAWWTVRESRRSDVPIQIYDGHTLIDTVTVNQKTNGGQWNLIKAGVTFTSNAMIVIVSKGDGTTCADAVKLVEADPSQQSETITITKAEYNLADQKLTVEATSSAGSGQTLTLQGYGQMTWNDGKYEYRVKPSVQPGNTVTVTSTSGASATATVIFIGDDGGGNEDTIQIQRAKYNEEDHELIVRATSSAQPDAVLTIAGYGVMSWDGNDNRYEFEARVSQPSGNTITVQSSQGGSATRNITFDD